MNDNIDYKEEIKKLLEKAREPYTFKRVYKLLEYLYIQEATEEKEEWITIRQRLSILCRIVTIAIGWKLFMHMWKDWSDNIIQLAN